MIYINKYWAKQPFSAAEKQWRYRTWRDGNPERRERYLEKELEKYREDLQLGSKKRINELSEGEKRRQCKKCRETYHDIKGRKEALVLPLLTAPSYHQFNPWLVTSLWKLSSVKENVQMRQQCICCVVKVLCNSQI